MAFSKERVRTKLMDRPAQKMLRMLASGLDLILTGYFCQLSFSFLHFNPIDSKLALPDSFLEGEKRTLQKYLEIFVHDN